MNRILVPLDGSELAEGALPHARALAQALGAKVLLVRSRTMPSGDVFLPPSMIRVPDVEGPAIKDYLAGFEEESVAATGSAAEAILNEAARADLIVMTSHGRSGLGRWLLGSVAEEVVRKSPCPVLVVGSRTPARDVGFGRLLVPLDGSENSELALAEAERLARAFGSTIYLLRAIVTPAGEHALPSEAAAHAAEERMVKEYLEECAGRVSGVAVERRWEAGPAARVIGEMIDREAIDLVVMCTHGRSGWNRFVCGSVAEAVLRAAQCPVWLVKAPPEREGAGGLTGVKFLQWALPASSCAGGGSARCEGRCSSGSPGEWRSWGWGAWRSIASACWRTPLSGRSWRGCAG